VITQLHNYKILTKLLLFLLAANAGLSGCETDKEIPTPIPTSTPAPVDVDTCFTNTSPQNLIKNTSFECDGQPTGQYWYKNYTELTGDSSTMSQDAPQGGENWSLPLIGSGNDGNDWAYIYITGQLGTGIYTLSLWMKEKDGWPIARAALQVISKSQFSQGKYVDSDSTNWKLYTLTDTLTTQPSDTIIVSLFAGAGGPLWGSALFDLVQLERIPQ